jgi:hypothetical protein
MFSRRGTFLAAACCLWLSAIAVGLGALAWYDNAPAELANVPAAWPSESQLHLGEQGQTLVLFAHPRCPCTRSTLSELEKLVAHCQQKVTPWIVFFKPDGETDDWARTDLWNTASAIPGAHVMCDEGGREARLFQATTSGQTLLYDASGKLQFNGGITFARGHAGDNAGRTAIESYCAGDAPGYGATPIFGCSIVAASKQE